MSAITGERIPIMEYSVCVKGLRISSDAAINIDRHIEKMSIADLFIEGRQNICL